MARQKLSKKEKFAAAKAQHVQTQQKDIPSVAIPGWWKYLPVVLALIVYANTLTHGFALDDYAAILENTSTRKGLAALGEIFRTSYRFGYILLGDELYRPFTKAIFAAFWDFWPNNPFPGHLLNVLLFSFTCGLIYKLMLKWWPAQPAFALLTSALFAVHPIHTEVVANIKSLDEILAFLFCLISLGFYLEYPKAGKRRYLVYSALCYFLAFLNKESAVTFIVIFPLMDWLVNRRSLKSGFGSILIMMIPLFLFFSIRYQVLHSDIIVKSAAPSVADNMLSAAKDPLTRISGAVAMLGLYVWKLLLPVSLSFDLSYPEVSPAKMGDWKFILSAISLLALLLVAIAGLKRRSRWSAALLFFFITVSISSNIFILIGTHYGERLMYAPSLGFCMAAALILVKVGGDKKDDLKIPPALWMVSGIIVLVFGFLSIRRNPVWKDNLSLYSSGLISAPNSGRVHYYQGLILVKPETLAGFPESSRDSAERAGINHLKKSVELYPAFADAWTQLGVASYRKKDYRQALLYYDEALKYNKYDPVVYSNSGTAHFEMGNYNEALRLFTEAVRLKPDYADAYMNIGSCYGVGGQFDLALANFEKAVYYNPDLSTAYYMMGVTWKNKGNEQMANQYFQKAEMVKAKK